jgi:cobalt-zinc-cadmium efflux system membrane fusion protein
VCLLSATVLAGACSDDARESPGEGDAHEEQHHEEGVVELTPEMVARAAIRTEPASTRSLPRQLQTTGQVGYEEDRLAHVSPRVPGRVEEVLADLGDEVRKGQELVVIDSVELGQAKAAYLEARAGEELARQNYEREQGLFAQRISSEKDALTAKAAHLEAVARLRSAEETLHLYGVPDEQLRDLDYGGAQASLLPIRAPLAGRVVEKHVTIGELVMPERSLFTIADLGHVWIWIDVYERDLGSVHIGDDVEVTVDADPASTFHGQVTYVSDKVDPDTRTVRARIDVDNPERTLRPGMFARVTVSDPHSTSAGPSLAVPAGAVLREGDGFIVFVALGEGRFERRQVGPGRKTVEFVEILSGLEPGAEVVVEGGFLLRSEASKDEMGAGHEH